MGIGLTSDAAGILPAALSWQMDEDRRKRAENLNRIKHLNAAAPKDRTLFHRMEQEYAARTAAEEQAKRQAVLDERHRSYRQPVVEVRPPACASRSGGCRVQFCSVMASGSWQLRRHPDQYINTQEAVWMLLTTPTCLWHNG